MVWQYIGPVVLEEGMVSLIRIVSVWFEWNGRLQERCQDLVVKKDSKRFLLPFFTLISIFSGFLLLCHVH